MSFKEGVGEFIISDHCHWSGQAHTYQWLYLHGIFYEVINMHWFKHCVTKFIVKPEVEISSSVYYSLHVICLY